MRQHGWARLCVLTASSLGWTGLMACGSDDGTSQSGVSSTEGTGPGNANGGGTGGSGAAGLTTQTNLPSSARVSVSNSAAATGVKLVSFNLKPDATSSLNYVEWLGEVTNIVGASTTAGMSLPEQGWFDDVTARARAAAGDGGDKGSPRRRGFTTLSASCGRPPGAKGNKTVLAA